MREIYLQNGILVPGLSWMGMAFSTNTACLICRDSFEHQSIFFWIRIIFPAVVEPAVSFSRPIKVQMILANISHLTAS